MPMINIPDSALPGFNSVSKLTQEQIKQFTEFLSNVIVGVKMDEINDFLFSNLSVPESKSIVQTLIGFSELLQPSNVNIEELSENLASSYRHKIGEEEFSKAQEETLKNNLLSIFKHSENFKLTLKAFDLVREDSLLYSDSKIITDIRLIFSDELENQNRHGVVIHKLKIEYYKDRQKKELFFALDQADLTQLKSIIERAIKKEDLIKKDYERTFHFLNLSDVL